MIPIRLPGTLAALLAVMLVVTISACANQSGSTDDGNEVKPDPHPTAEHGDDADYSETPAAEAPDPSEISRASDSISHFGFDMFSGLAGLEPDENVIVSPQSAAILLALLFNGAEGETREAIGEVLYLEDPFDDSINDEHRLLASYLMSADPDVELAIANSLWANEGTPFEEDYLDRMREYFDATINEVDLGEQASADQIDEWVAENTNDRIQEMAQALGLPDPNAVMVLLNAVYFLGNWTEPFDPDQTADGTFSLPDGEEITLPMMNRDDDTLFTEQDGFKAIRLPYGEKERFGMEIFLPSDEHDLGDLREELDADLWQETTGSFSEQRVNVELPSFEIEYDTGSDLDEVLRNLGMGIAYEGGSDFTPMTSADPWLSSVVQKTFIRVDEEGTEAAAVTGGGMVDSLPPQFIVDRPFFFTISDRETSTILFMGQVTNPTE